MSSGAVTEKIVMDKMGLHVALPADNAYFNYCWLRDNCPSSFDVQTRERIFDICALDQEPVAKSAKLIDN
jgi:gamma-butyrobetaine dioxygenase